MENSNPKPLSEPVAAAPKRGRGRPRKSDQEKAFELATKQPFLPEHDISSRIDSSNIISVEGKSHRSKRRAAANIEYSSDVDNNFEEDEEVVGGYDERDDSELPASKKRKGLRSMHLIYPNPVQSNAPLMNDPFDVFCVNLGRIVPSMDETTLLDFCINEWAKMDQDGKSEFIMKKGPGRPRKVIIPESIIEAAMVAPPVARLMSIRPSPPIQISSRPQSPVSGQDEEQPVRRKRGRPKKEEGCASTSVPASPTAMPKKPTLIRHTGAFPCDDELSDAVLRVMQSDDLSNLTVNKVRRKLESMFKYDMKYRHSFIKCTVDHHLALHW